MRLLFLPILLFAAAANPYDLVIRNGRIIDGTGSPWYAGDIAIPNTEEWISPNETTAIQLADGRVMLNARSESKAQRRLITISPDGSTNIPRPTIPRFDQNVIEDLLDLRVRHIEIHHADDGRALSPAKDLGSSDKDNDDDSI